MEIGVITKGSDRIIVAVKEFKGREYIDIRTHFENDKGEWIPTKKGVTLTPDTIDEMIHLLTDARDQMGKK